MTHEELEAYFRSIGWQTESVAGTDGNTYLLIHDYPIPAGTFAGRVCDLGIMRTPQVPYIPPPAIHVRPYLVPVAEESRFGITRSQISTEWQYWSRVVPPERHTPAGMVAHIATVFCQVPPL